MSFYVLKISLMICSVQLRRKKIYFWVLLAAARCFSNICILRIIARSKKRNSYFMIYNSSLAFVERKPVKCVKILQNILVRRSFNFTNKLFTKRQYVLTTILTAIPFCFWFEKQDLLSKISYHSLFRSFIHRSFEAA